MTYIGRFAPSPTGLLHFGSLLAATASYLQARSQQGQWLLRIEDLDKPREPVGAADAIIQTLGLYGFEWDQTIVYQSQRIAAYTESLNSLKPFIYGCNCSRKQLQTRANQGDFGLIYPRICRDKYLALTPLTVTGDTIVVAGGVVLAGVFIATAAVLISFGCLSGNIFGKGCKF